MYENDRTAVYRETSPAGTGTVIVKQALGPDACARTQHERMLLDRLATVNGVPRVVSQRRDDVLVVEDAGGQSLAELIADTGPVTDPGQVLALARDLARVLADVHAAGVVHRDLNPFNVVARRDQDGSLVPALVDFDLATTFAEVRPAFVADRQIAGRLPYLAPEQTGRTGQPVDHRADLYGLGATLYEIATGQPPLGAGDPLQLVRDILTRIPADVREQAPGLPPLFASALARLLEKEPQARYASASGLAHDLTRLAADPRSVFVLGTRDFPARLTPPSRLAGREAETARLAAALGRAVAGRPQLVLLSGGPGVGKSAVAGQLRPELAARSGIFLTGKADQYGGSGQDVLGQVLGQLGRFLLAMSPAQLDLVRARVLAHLGANAGLAAGLAPEIAVLLGREPEDAADGPSTRIRRRRTVRDLLSVVAGPERPLLLFLDDLQWTGQFVLDVVDGLLEDGGPPGLLIVGTYRDEAVDEAHPLTAMLRRWERLGAEVESLPVRNLPPDDVATLLAGMLRLEPGPAADLAEVIAERTGGNPFVTVELVNALRGDGILTLTAEGWHWDADEIRRFVGATDVADLLQHRLTRLPDATRDLMVTLSCLGAEAPLAVLAVAHGLPAEIAFTHALPALEDGLLVAVGGTGAAYESSQDAVLRFRHDRVQQATHDSVSDGARAHRRLAAARRLAEAGHDLAAAAQYLHTVNRPQGPSLEPGELRPVIALFRAGAVAARRANDLPGADRYLAAASTLHDSLPAAASPDTAEDLGLALDMARHATLCALGRQAEADAVFGRIRARGLDPVRLAGPASLQITQLTVRKQGEDAVRLGLGLLGALGIHRPADDALAEAVALGYDAAEAWLRDHPADADLARPEVSDPRALAAGAVLGRLATLAFFSDHLLLGWIVTASLTLWAEHGPQRDLLLCLGHANSRGLGLRSWPDLDRDIVQRALVVGEARGYEPVTALSHVTRAAFIAPWFEPLESVVAEATTARESLFRSGEVAQGLYSYYPTLLGQLDSAPGLAPVLEQTRTAISLAGRYGAPHVAENIVPVLAFLSRLSGPGDADAGSAASPDHPGGGPVVLNHWYTQAVAAAIAGDPVALQSAVTAAEPAEQLRAGTYVSGVLRMLRGLAAAMALQEHGLGHPDSVQWRHQLTASRDLMHTWSGHAPGNARHLALLLDAEQAAADGDTVAALAAYDAALDAADGVTRPWHQALIAQRAGEFALRQGCARQGRALLGEARRRYVDWGAPAAAAWLDQRHPGLGAVRAAAGGSLGSRRGGSTSVGLTRDALDMMAILNASQAISSQTDPDRLQHVLAGQLGSLTGATAVHLVAKDLDTGLWTVHRDGGGTLDLRALEAQHLVPLSVVRYTERTGEPLLVANPALDDRFARDPYLARLERCSLLSIPVTAAGQLRAVLVLVNELSAGAFTTDRLDAVQLIAGQLAVSLDNALLYRSMETMVAARTEELQAATRQLEILSLTDALTQVANRRRFEQFLASEWAAAQAASRPMAVMMLDVDHFKQYNDGLGHQEGDRCLAEVATALAGTTRDVDLVARYGGEEFAVVLKGAHIDVARRVAERFREAVARLGLAHPSGGTVSVSIGVASTVPDASGSSAALLAAADGALYLAKRNGRNRVEAAPPA